VVIVPIVEKAIEELDWMERGARAILARFPDIGAAVVRAAAGSVGRRAFHDTPEGFLSNPVEEIKNQIHPTRSTRRVGVEGVSAVKLLEGPGSDGE
jgi:hypothetical protein